MLTPQSEQEVAEIIRAAEKPLAVQGGGTRAFTRTSAQDRLSLTELSGVELYEPGALTLVVAAGTPMEEVDAVLAAENQRLPFEPMDHRALLGTNGQPTIGGVVAANVSGPRRIQAGACRDALIGVRFVGGTGSVLKNGGRVMKNVTGYDLVKLMAGSYGTLGVMTQVSFKVLPGIADTATLQIEAASVESAVQIMSTALGSPFEVSGAAFDPTKAQVSLRLEGFAESVKYRLSQLEALLADHGAARRLGDAEESRAHWSAIRDVHALRGTDGDLWRISVTPSDAPAVANALGGGVMLFDWGGGLIWARVPKGTDLRAKLAGISGHATCLVGDFPTFHPELAPIAKLSAGLRAQFDPRGLLNPELMG